MWLNRFLGVAAGFLGIVIGGCNGAAQVHPAHQRLPAPAQTISIYQLAGRLKLRVEHNGRTYALLRSRRNTVTIFPDPGGSIYVNGVRLRHSGPIRAVQTVLFVPASSARPIEMALRPEPPPHSAQPPTPPARQPVVVLDPGHGGRDPGAIAASGMFEKDVVLPVALMARRYLEAFGVRVVMTRRGDRFVGLEERAELANKVGADLFVSIHADSCPRAAISGHTLYVARAPLSASLDAARDIDRALSRAGVRSRGIRRGDYRVLVRTTCPAVLVEIGYLSNRFEARRLAGNSHRQNVAYAIARGVADFLGR